MTHDVQPGDTRSVERQFTERNVNAFREVSGDYNDIHYDERYAADTRFGERVVPGMLAATTISGAISRFPDVPILVEQDLEYVSPVKLYDYVEATARVKRRRGDDVYALDVVATVGDEIVIEGDVVVLFDEHPYDDQ